MLAVLRGDPAARPTADPAVVEAARAHPEAAAAAWTEAIPPEVVVRVTKDAVSSVRRCEARHLAELAARSEPQDPPPPAVVRGRLLDALFRQVATIGTVGADPVADALAACDVEGDSGRAGLDRRDQADGRRVRDEVVLAAERLVAEWPPLPAGAGVRTQERLIVAVLADPDHQHGGGAPTEADP